MNHTGSLKGWALRVQGRTNHNKAACALANKLARICYAVLLIHGTRAVLAVLRDKDRISCWLRALVERRGYKRAAVALAAKNARIIWAMLTHGEDYRVSSVGVAG